MQIPDRVRWAVEVVDPAPDSRVLEIGCGPGAAAELICARLDTGRLLAVDRSAVAVGRAVERNAQHVKAGRLEVRQSDLDALEVEPRSFDVAFSVNVNVFWTRDAASELAVLRRALRPEGLLHVLYGPGPGGSAAVRRVADTVSRAMSDNGFAEVTSSAEERGTRISGEARAGG